MNKIICGDALTVLRTLPDKCCRCCVTSPPYFNLRDYGVSGQIGLEPTMQEYIARLVEVFAEVKRVLTDDGNCENNTGKRRMRSVWNMATTASGGVTHYAKFPNELAERCILCGTAEGDVVLDPFVGGGTSCRVANRYGRQYIGD